MSRLLLIGINYWLEVTGIAPYTTELAEHLAARGNRVSVLTGFPYYPQWRIHGGYYRHLRPYLVEQRNGVKVIRCPLLLPRSRQTAFRRILFDSSIAASTLLAGIANARQDLVICISPPLQLGVTARFLARLGGARLMLHLQDLVPDAAIAAGMIADGFATRIARKLELFVYKHADKITVVSQGFLENLVAKGVPRPKLRLLANWVDVGRFAGAQHPYLREQLGAANGETLVLHTGNMGAKQGLETVVEATALLRADKVVVGLVGDGQVRRRLEKRAKDLKLTNLRFVELQDDYPSTLACADILVLSQRGRMIDSVAPSKLLSYMAAGKPVAAAVDAESEAGRLIRRAGCGVVVPPDEPQALAKAIRSLAGDRSSWAAMGAAGKREVERNYDQRALLTQWEEVVRDLVRR